MHKLLILLNSVLYTNNITLESLAEKLGVSKSEFIGLFLKADSSLVSSTTKFLEENCPNSVSLVAELSYIPTPSKVDSEKEYKALQDLVETITKVEPSTLLNPEGYDLLDEPTLAWLTCTKLVYLRRVVSRKNVKVDFNSELPFIPVTLIYEPVNDDGTLGELESQYTDLCNTVIVESSLDDLSSYLSSYSMHDLYRYNSIWGIADKISHNL